MDPKDKPTVEQLAHLFRLIGDGICTRANFQAYLEKPNGLTVESFTPIFTHDKTKDGWKLLEAGPLLTELKIKDLELVSFLRSGESYINGEEMHRRATEQKCTMGQNQAEYLLSHQEEIPTEFRKHCLVFSGTVWQGSDGDRYVPFLVWNGGRWYLDFGWLDDDFWSDGNRFVQARK